MITEEAHATALKTAIKAVVGRSVLVLDRDEVSALDDLPDNYVEIDLEVRFSDTRFMTGDPVTTPWRVIVDTVAMTVTNARTIREQVRGAFSSLTISSTFAKPELETTAAIAQDKQGRWLCTDTFVYSLNN